MAKEFFVEPNDPVLVQVAAAVPVDQIKSPKIQEIIDKLHQAAGSTRIDRSKPNLVGIAAPQIGISERIILVDTGADGLGKLTGLSTYINPEITWSSKEKNEWYEGCGSTSRVCGVVSRPTKIKVRALDEDGREIEEEHAGYVARIFQHEVDHLNGKEFTTHISDDANLHWVEEEEFPEYRNKEAWRTWSKKCPRAKWEKIKGIRH